MFPYDGAIAAAVGNTPRSISDVLATMQAIDGICSDTDGLKWFNQLYLSVTRAVEAKVSAVGFGDPGWLSELDVQFANLYFSALAGGLTEGSCPDCWKVMLSARHQTRIARIQFAFAGMNAHINHDLPVAIVLTSVARNTIPRHGTAQYNDYTSVNAVLGGLIDIAKRELNVRLPGDPLPAVSHLEDLIASWNLAEFREEAWDAAENMWGEPDAEIAARMDLRDVLVAGLSRALLIPVP